MAETPFSPDAPESPAPAEEAPQEASEATAPVDTLAEALDEDDLPEPRHGSSPPAPEAVARPEPTPAPPPPAPAPPAPAPPADAPSIATSLEVPPLPAGSLPTEEGGGGEWELLTAKVRQWFGEGEPQKLLDSIGGPLRAVAYFVGLLLVLRVYRSVVGTIDGIPLVSGLLELVGLIALVRFCLLRLVRRSEREQVLGTLQKRWDDFRGRD
jgi:hypothetical protein